MSLPTPQGLVFPLHLRQPKAAVFLRCNASHIFTTAELKADTPKEDEMAHIFGPCPRCRATTVYPHTIAGHMCAFCNRQMAYNDDGTLTCRTEACWFSRTKAETSTEHAVKLWARVYRDQANAYIFGNERETTRTADYLENMTDADLRAAQALMNISKGVLGNSS